MINILYLHGSAEQYGADVVLYELLKGLNKELFKPYVILPINGPLVMRIAELGIDVEIHPYPVARRQYFTPTGIINYLIQYFSAVKYLKKFCDEKDIQIIHSNTVAVLEGIALKKMHGIKHVWHLHEMLDKPEVVYRIYSFLIRHFGGNVVAVSNAVRDHWLNQRKTKLSQVKVIHNGIDHSRFNPNNEVDYLKKEFGIEEGETVVGMIGRVNAIKGQDVFVRALEIVIEQKPNVKAILIGGVFEGQEWRFERLKKRINDSRFNSNFVLRDYRNDIANIHCLFDLLIFPSIQNDSFSTVLIEAMASGKAIVSFKNGGVVEMIEDGLNGLYADFGNAQSLAEKILLLLADENLKATMGRNNVEKQHRYFSAASYCSNFCEFYQGII